ncbi:hypothetical protein [Lentzea flava]|uniref:Lipoprotein n=1 Tax=Lentzea flava TaxID=103732 RepID=A0ABQ2UMF3_9PSEU|nr:hypothetical protein [Lentzea flava]MCP2201793.1 hypothetical protein [Lentzea flava]GGU44753.1 hypothetical protein GCM10010178_41500 [Lentzea flava]
MRRVLPLVLALAACTGPEPGPKITGQPEPNQTASATTPPASSAAAGPTLGPAPEDLRSVDWRQATLPAGFCHVGKPVRLSDGTARATSELWGSVEVFLDVDVHYGDVDGDGREEAAISLGCDNGGGTASSQLAFGFAVVRSARGALEVVGEITPTTMRDDATHVPLLSEPKFEKGAITVKELWYRPSDANCCPSGASLTRWWLRDGALKADPPVQVS